MLSMSTEKSIGVAVELQDAFLNEVVKLKLPLSSLRSNPPNAKMPNWISRVTKGTPVISISESPPSAAKRREKEHNWFASLKQRSPPRPAIPATAAATTLHIAANSSALENGPRHVLLPRPNGGHNASSASSAPASDTTSEATVTRKRSFLSRKKSSATLKSPKDEPLEANYLFVQPNGLVAAEGPSLPPPSGPAPSSLGLRLQELSSANEAGLLDDQEYRSLRQAIFAKFAENSTSQTAVQGSSLQLTGMSNS
jgi:hypothetical protein